MRQLLKSISPFNDRMEMPTALFVLKKVLAFWLCYIAGLFIAEGAVILLHFAFGKNMLVGDIFDAQTIRLITYYGYIIVVGVVLLYWKLIEKKPLAQMGLTKHPGSYLIGAAAGITLVALSVTTIVLTGNIEYCGVPEHTDIPMLLLLVGGFVVQGAAEELLCRGLVLHSLMAKTSLGVAVSVSTLLFILPHLPSLLEGGVIYGVLGIVNLTLISTIFSLVTVIFGSIWAACGLHSFWNAVLYAILGLNLSGNDEAVTAIFDMRSVGKNIWNGGDYGIEASVITTAVLAIAAVLLRHISSRLYKNAFGYRSTNTL